MARGYKRVELLTVKDRDLVSERRRQIAEAAFRVFVEMGYHNTPVREIAKAAGLSPGSLFNYFASKEEILLFIFEAVHSKIEELVKGLSVGKEKPLVAFEQAFERYLRLIDEYQDYILLVYQEFKSIAPQAKRTVLQREHRIAQIFQKILQELVKKGLIPGQDLELKVHTIIVLGHMWAFRRWALKELTDLEGFIQAHTRIAMAILQGPRGAGRREGANPARVPPRPPAVGSQA